MNQTPALPAPVRAPAHINQVTAVEQARAVAEVQAAVVVAQQCPRDRQAALEEMRESCRNPRLADRAFYSVPNRGQGPTVHLARELARIFGNIQYGVHELHRDDRAGNSEVQAFAWDVQTNTRSTRTFQVPHERMVKKERVRLTDLGDIYLNNQNIGARAVRECILTVLPPWFSDEAQDLCHQTLRNGGGKPLAVRVADAVNGFEALGVSVEQLERRAGRPASRWTEIHVANLGILYRSIERGETTIGEEFDAPAAGPSKVAVVDLKGASAAPVPDGDPEPAPTAEPEQPADPERELVMVTPAQLRKMGASMGDLGVKDRADRLTVTSEIVGRDIGSAKELTMDEARRLIDTLEAEGAAELVADVLGWGQDEQPESLPVGDQP